MDIYVLTNVHVFSKYFIDVITIINTQLKNISINYLLFDSNTRRIILIKRHKRENKLGKISDGWKSTDGDFTQKTEGYED